MIIIRRESPLVVMALKRERSTGGLAGRSATGRPGLLFQSVGRSAPTGPDLFWTCNQGITLVVCAEHSPRSQRWRAALSRAMSWFSTTKANHFSPEVNIALMVRRTSSITRRLNHVNLHRFWARWSGKSDNRRLGVGLGNSEILTEGNRKCLLQCGRLRTLK